MEEKTTEVKTTEVVVVESPELPKHSVNPPSQKLPRVLALRSPREYRSWLHAAMNQVKE